MRRDERLDKYVDVRARVMTSAHEHPAVQRDKGKQNKDTAATRLTGYRHSIDVEPETTSRLAETSTWPVYELGVTVDGR
jgi:hypothetical protein